MLTNESVQTETVTPPAEPSSAPIESAAPAAAVATDGQVAPPVAETYTPDFTYKVVNEVKEFDPRLRSIIKSKDDESWVRDIITKAEGLETNKRNLETTAKELQTYKAAYEPLKKDVDYVLQMADKKDIAALSAVFGLTEKDILDYAYQLVELKELPKHQQDIYNQRNEYAREQYALRQQNEEMARQLQSIQVQQRQTELQNTINSSEYASIAKEFDQRNGPDSFYNEVVRRGLLYAREYKVQKSPQEVMSEIVQLYGLKRVEQPKTTTVASGSGSIPVIPNTGSSGAAPIARKLKSYDEVAKWAKANLTDD